MRNFKSFICFAMLLKHGLKNKLLFWAITLVLSGGIGNMIDRIFNGGVVIDFLHFEFIDFPVFNIADCAIVLGGGLLILYFIVDFVKERRELKRQ
jgi:signal peptidase II